MATYRRRIKLSTDTLRAAETVTRHWSMRHGIDVPLEGILSDAVVVGLDVLLRQIAEESKLGESSTDSSDPGGTLPNGPAPEIPSETLGDTGNVGDSGSGSGE